MQSHTSKTSLTGPALSSAGDGVEVAKKTIKVIRAGRSVLLDFSAVERMTPSFANALVMTMLEDIGVEKFDASVAVCGTKEHVRESWRLARERYQRGIRLSTQRSPSAK